MNYLYRRIEAEADFEENTPARRAFRLHLDKVTRALKEIEWVDSGDTMPGDENKAIFECLPVGQAVLLSMLKGK